MKIATREIPLKIDAPGAQGRQATGFGDATGAATMGAEHFRLAAGTDITPLLKGLEGDLCQSPHWGYMIGGEVTATYRDGTSESIATGDLFYWPPGHTVRADRDAEFVLFSPQDQHTPVLEHIGRQVNGSRA